jgi:hypothetical protein
MKWYKINTDLSREKYNAMLDRLAATCDTFALVEPIVILNEFPYKIPPTKNALSGYLIEKKCVLSWPGTWRPDEFIDDDDMTKSIQHTYRCCPESVDELRGFSSFFDIEDQLDISFFDKGQCALCTVSHEGMFMIDLDFWGDFFEEYSSQMIFYDKWM